MKLVGKRILIISPNHWGTMHISKHHYAKALAKRNNTVYFLNPPNIKGPFYRKKLVENNLYVIDYYPLFRGKSILPSAVFDMLIKAQIKFLQFKLGRIDILWSFSFNIYYNLKWFKAKLRIFHPVDQLNSPKSRSIGDSADIIFTCSGFIINELSGIKKPKVIIPHGLSNVFLSKEINHKKDSDIINICYVGNLFIENLDRDLLKKVITNLSGNNKFHFIGALKPGQSNISAWVRDESLEFVEFIQNQNNVICYDKLPSTEVASLIRKMDVFLLAYNQTEENKISNSHKILEYLSTGKVIVATEVEYYRNKEGLLEMVESREQFFDRLQHVVSHIGNYNDEVKKKVRVAYAKKHTYESNLEQIENSINEYCNLKRDKI